MDTPKKRIKRIALSLFANKGYEGTSISDIATEVGLKKASLYSHFKGKEELFFAVYEDVAEDYEKLNRTLITESIGMAPKNRLSHIFKGYILHYYQNPEIQAFWSRLLLFAPADFREKFMVDVIRRDAFFQENMEQIFREGIEEGVVRRDHPSRLLMSFRAMREGLLTWMVIVPQLKEEMIESFWTDLWIGITNGEKEKVE